MLTATITWVDMPLKPPDRAPLGMPVSEADLLYAISKAEGHKDVVVQAVKIEVFDLLNEEDREKCKKVELEVLNKIYAGTITVLSDKTEKMQRADGSTTWMRLIKWVEYGLED